MNTKFKIIIDAELTEKSKKLIEEYENKTNIKFNNDELFKVIKQRITDRLLLICYIVPKNVDIIEDD